MVLSVDSYVLSSDLAKRICSKANRMFTAAGNSFDEKKTSSHMDAHMDAALVRMDAALAHMDAALAYMDTGRGLMAVRRYHNAQETVSQRYWTVVERSFAIRTCKSVSICEISKSAEK